jgi:hypothetical protein
VGSPRLDVVFRLWQCDKKNHGWCEGPPVTVLCQSFDLLAGPSPSAESDSNEKRIQLCVAGCQTFTQNIGRLSPTIHSGQPLAETSAFPALIR